MTEGRTGKFWTLIILVLLIIITVSGYFTWQGLAGHRPVQIQLSPSPRFEGEILIDGDVLNPGFYPFTTGDRLSELLEAAGGINRPEPKRWRLYVSETSANETPQRIDINRAEAWLLKALPGIGDTLAEAIVSYRLQDGRFRNINELSQVAGIGPATLAQIKELITVAE